ncbi:MAG: hypothetical protein ACLR5S_11910 [Ruminococcus sp.]
MSPVRRRAIGDGCVIGAGSVVTRASATLAAGSPCRVIRQITNRTASNITRAG